MAKTILGSDKLERSVHEPYNTIVYRLKERDHLPLNSAATMHLSELFQENFVVLGDCAVFEFPVSEFQTNEQDCERGGDVPSQ